MASVLKRVTDKYHGMPTAAKAALWFTFSGVVLSGMSMLTMPIFTRLMTTEQYGLYALYSSWLQVLTVVTTLRLTYAVFNKGMSKYGAARDEFTASMQTITTIVTLVLLGVYVLFRGYVNQLTGLSTLITLAMFAELALSPAISFWICRIRYDFRYRPIVGVTLLMATGNALLGVIAVLVSEDKGTARILSCVAVDVAVGAYFYVYNLRKGRRLLVAEQARFALLFNLPLIPHYLSMYVLDQFDRIMVARMVGLTAAALYSVAYNMGLGVKIIADGITSAIIPWQYRRLEEGKISTVEKALYPILLLFAAFIIVFIAIAPELIAVLGGSKYAQAMYVVPPVAISTFFIFAYSIFGNVEFYFDANKFIMYVSIVGAVLNMVLNYVSIRRFGYIAAAYTTLFCYAGLALAHFYYMNHVVKKKTGGQQILRGRIFAEMSIALVVFGELLVLMYSIAWLRYGIVAIAAIVLVVKRDYIRTTFGRLRNSKRTDAS